MRKIRILPPEVANKIAAGEVVERPASVIRELLDNAVDAGADRIAVEVEHGGLSLMRVTDNGCGMSPEDAVLCTHRHATSKIRSAEDLQNIVTKGFRGEALASIAAISKVKLITRRAEDGEATLVQIDGGVQETIGPTAAPPGTTVIVSDLFFNTPARKKFLKKPTTEMTHICSAVTWLALNHEQVHFTLAHNHRTVMELPGVADRAERVMNLYGRDIIGELLPLSLDTPRVSISGFISRPTTTRNGTQHMFTFVNERYVRNKTIHRALMEGYRNILPTGRYPVVFLYIEVDPRAIDVNVHPTKQEVKFAHEDAIFSGVYGAVRQVWEQRGEPSTPPAQTPEPPSTPAPARETTTKEHVAPKEPTAPVRPLGPPNQPAARQDTVQLVGQASSLSASSLSASSLSDRQGCRSHPETRPSVPSASGAADREGKPVEIRSDLLTASSVDREPQLVVRGQLANGYILAEGKDGLFIIDQHAAHERILFERFVAQSKRGPLPSQKLLFPSTIDLSPADMETLSVSRKELERLGFEMEEFGPATYAIRAIPADLDIEAAGDLMRDIIGELQNEGSADEKIERALHSVACRAAVKLGDPLDKQAMQNIIDSLRTVSRRDFCPHGRPSVLLLSDDALRRGFRRT